jgi:hypothetical protein
MFGLTWDYVLTEITWIDIQMMLADIPFYDYKSENTIDPVDGKKVKAGTIEDLKKHFGHRIIDNKY